MKIFNWTTGLLVALALINWGTVYFFSLNIVDKILFNVGFLKVIVYGYVSLVGTLWLLVVLGILQMKDMRKN